MVLTVAITTHKAYDTFLDGCAASALTFGDEVVIYDNGGECHPVPGCRYVPLPFAPTVARSRALAIDEARGDWILHLDADDILIGRPPEYDADWVVSDMPLMGGGMWTYATREHTVEGAWKYLREHRDTPICSKSAWRLGWLRSHGLSWYDWPNVAYAEDCRTEIEYLLHSPRIVYDPEHPFYCYRIHAGQGSDDQAARALFVADLAAYLEGL